MEKEKEALRKEADALGQELEAATKHVKDLRNAFALERSRAGRAPTYWIVILALHVILGNNAWAHGRFVEWAMNFVAFLMCWRRFYLPEHPITIWVSILVLTGSVAI